MCLSLKRPGAKDAAYDFMNWWLSGWLAAIIATQGYYISNPQRSRPFMEKEGFQLILETAFPIIYANESRVLQAFENLMSNAFKYGRNASGENVVKIGSRKNDDEWFFYVKDNGRGIPKEYHEKIFGLFYRLDNTTEGTGIGLSIVQKVMQFHEGRVWVESEPEKGATFWLAFPKK